LTNILYTVVGKYLNIFGFIGFLYFLINEKNENAFIYGALFLLFYLLSLVVFRKISSIFIKLNFIFFYLGYLLSMPIIFYNADKYSHKGWRGIGSYNFEYSQTLDAAIIFANYITLFVFVSLIIDRIFLKPYRLDLNVGTSNYFDKLSRFSNYSPVLVFLIVSQIFLSFIMFQYSIGIVGIQPENLSFRISGILYYYRYFVIPIFIFLLLFSNFKKKNYIVLFLILLEILSAGVFSVSRALIILHSLPVVLFLIAQNRKKMLSLVLVFIIFCLSVATISRDFVYSVEDFHQVEFLEAFDMSLLFSKMGFVLIFDTISTIILRAKGIYEFLATFYSEVEYVNINLFLNKTIGFFWLDYGGFSPALDVFNISLPKNYAFGMDLDNLSYLFLSANSSLEVLALVSLWVFSLIAVEKIVGYVAINHINKAEFLIFLNFYYILWHIHPAIRAALIVVTLLLAFYRFLRGSYIKDLSLEKKK